MSSSVHTVFSFLVQPPVRCNKQRQALADANLIFTRPEGRVQQPKQHVGRTFGPMFQSSPDPKVGCNKHRASMRGPRMFQSSPDPKVGCNLSDRRRRGAWPATPPPRPPLTCFNPHPTRRSGATPILVFCTRMRFLFQSSPDPKVGCNLQRSGHTRRISPVGSSPDPKVGCNFAPLERVVCRDCFNPHPTRRSGATSTVPNSPASSRTFQSSPDPKVGCNSGCGARRPRRSSFNPHPTRRSGATLRGAGGTAFRFRVSILTRPEGRVQLTPRRGRLSVQSFNPHPTRRSGATNDPGRCRRSGGSVFQSSPDPKVGCNMGRMAASNGARVSILTRPEGRVQQKQHVGRTFGPMFQSSPDPKVGCNPVPHLWQSGGRSFNPHPTRRSGATGYCRCTPALSQSVSILTRPEGRVQHCVFAMSGLPVSFNPHPTRRSGATVSALRVCERARVSILTRPEGRVQPRRRVSPGDVYNVSILTRPEGRVQPLPCQTVPDGNKVSILTRPEGRVQHARREPRRPERTRFNPHPTRRSGATKVSRTE